MSCIAVRKAVPADAAIIAEFERAYIDCAWSEAQIASEIARDGIIFLVATLDGKTIGYLSGECAADECEISNIAVDEAYRRMGAGTELFYSLIGEARARGVKRLFLLVNSKNAGAISLYDSLGFCAVGLRRGYYGDGDATVMRLEL